jgi:hypothetical protein
MYAGPGMKFMDPNISQGLNGRPNRKGGKSGNKKLPRHSRPGNLAISATKQNKGCVHALSHYENVTTPNGKGFTVKYALRCVVGHKVTTKSPTHKDLAGRKWQ